MTACVPAVAQQHRLNRARKTLYSAGGQSARELFDILSGNRAFELSRSLFACSRFGCGLLRLLIHALHLPAFDKPAFERGNAGVPRVKRFYGSELTLGAVD